MKEKKNDKVGGKGKTGAPQKKGKLLPLAIALALLAAGGGAFFYFRPTLPDVAAKIRNALSVQGDGTPSADKNEINAREALLNIQDTLAKKFEELEMRKADYTIQHIPKDNLVVIDAVVPRGRPIERIIRHLSKASDGTPYEIYDCYCATPVRCEITFTGPDDGYQKISLTLRQEGRYISTTARMAILIENLGFEVTETTARILSFKEPLTVTLIPSRKMTEWAERIDEHKKEIALSLPMEPLPAQFAEHRGGMIRIDHDERRVRAIFDQAAAAVPLFKGVTNFHGSGVMRDSDAMKKILTEVGRRKIYFVYDTANTSRRSVAPELARGMNVRSHLIQGTIGAALDAEQARREIKRYAVVAEKTGRVLIKAQPTPAFIEALEQEAPLLRGNGIRLVYVSDLIK